MAPKAAPSAAPKAAAPRKKKKEFVHPSAKHARKE
jgi:hypothetical protein